jgi:Phospholipid N-methyltransferase
MNSFFKEAVKSLKSSGAITPSSKYVIEDCMKGIDFSKATVLVEFGTGNGCITEALLARMRPDARLFAFEINDSFYKYCEEKFKDEPRITMINAPASSLTDILRENGLEQADFIVSSIPLTLVPSSESVRIFNSMQENLSATGAFIQYQYSLAKYSLVKRYFKNIELSFTLRNFPPAFVFYCYL